jgi:hypothetical protein
LDSEVKVHNFGDVAPVLPWRHELFYTSMALERRSRRLVKQRVEWEKQGVELEKQRVELNKEAEREMKRFLTILKPDLGAQE